MEIDNPGLRHNSFIRSLCFDLESELRLFYQDGVCYPVSSGNVFKKAQRAKLNMDGKTRKKFLSDCRFFGTLSTPKALAVLKTLNKSYPKESLIGFRKHGQVVHCFRDYTRVKHILGLSDAVDQAMSNFGMTISFPSFVSARLRPGQAQVARSRTFCKVSNHPFVQLDFRFKRRSLRTRARRFDLILHYLRVFPKKLEEKTYVKIIKTSLAGTFSLKMDQPIPEDFPEIGIPLFPSITQRKLDSVLKNKKKRVQFYFNLLQSKALCSPVGEDMISEAYVKHRLALCAPKEDTLAVDVTLYEKLKAYGRDVGKHLDYNPFETSFPNAKASIEKNTLQGGNRKALKTNGTLTTFSSHPILGLSEGQVRLEPYVIGLFGPPGSGKTTLVNRIVQNLRYHMAPRDMAREDFVYSRSCSTKHWDGYHGQPVVILDDFGQNLEDRTDLSEFMTLISINDYVLPMAELSEKGTKFNSPIVIVTSNVQFGASRVANSSGGDTIEDPLALWRRFDLPLLVEKGIETVAQYKISYTDDLYQGYERKHKTKVLMKTSNWPYSGRTVSANQLAEAFSRHIPKIDLVDTIRTELQEKFDFHRYTFHDSWTQRIASKHISFEKFTSGPIWDPVIKDVEDESIFPNARRVYMDFPAFPPSHAPIVKAQALPEPLKVRMITVAEADTKVLQPFQQSLWRYLCTKPQFCLTNGVKELEDFEGETLPWIYRIEKVIQRIRDRSNLIDEPLWLSGDYTAATDNFPMWVTEALVEGILENISHEPTRRWVRWEVSPHEMRYPEGVIGHQTSGQLMGSLLSFPLLCFLNDFVMKESGFDPLSYLINGDDVVACDEISKIESWKELAPRVGLSLSVGKNFIDPDFCTVNSQLFYRGDVLHTGKVSCQHRLGQTIGYTFQEAQFYWGATPEIKENFLTRNWTVLKQTPRSLHFSTGHGGLGLVDSCEGIRYDANLHKRVYLYDCLHRFSLVHKVEGAPFSFVAVPLLRGDAAVSDEGKHHSLVTFEKFQSLVEPELRQVSASADLTHRQVRDFHSWLAKGVLPEIDVIEKGSFSLEKAPVTSFLDVHYLAVTNGLATKVARDSVRYAYNLIREQWLESSLSSPFEYIDGSDMIEQSPSLQDLFDSYEYENLDIVRLFREEDPVDEEGNKLNSEVLQFWDPVERLESLDGGRLFCPRPQGFQALDEFLSLFESRTDINEQMLVDDLDFKRIEIRSDENA
nr:MAG: putative RNA-dependent RNA polymerase [Narnaviridae sp.]